MSFASEAFKTLKEVVLVNERIERLSHVIEQLDRDQRHTHERLVRVEVFIDMLSEARKYRAFPRG